MSTLTRSLMITAEYWALINEEILLCDSSIETARISALLICSLPSSPKVRLLHALNVHMRGIYFPHKDFVNDRHTRGIGADVIVGLVPLFLHVNAKQSKSQKVSMDELFHRTQICLLVTFHLPRLQATGCRAKSEHRRKTPSSSSRHLKLLRPHQKLKITVLELLR